MVILMTSRTTRANTAIRHISLFKSPKAHAESWYGALNQARLVLATRFDLFDSNGDETVAISWEGERPTVMVDDSSQNPHPVETRINAFLRNQAYGFIQEWLIAQVLSAEL